MTTLTQVREGSFLDSVWGTVDRLAARGASAALLLILAWSTNLSELGIYSVGVLLFTLVQSASDASLRQIAPALLDEHGGESRLNRTARRCTLIAPLGLTLCLALFFAAEGRGVVHQVGSLVPLILTTAVSPWNALMAARLQLKGRWRAIAVCQVAATAAALGVTVPLVVLLSPAALLVCMQAILTEALMWFLLRRMVRGISQPEAKAQPADEAGSRMLPMACYNLLTWGKGQSDRLVLLLVVGPIGLGLYSLALSLSRAPGEAGLSGLVNIVRTALRGGVRESAANRARLRRLTLQAMVLAIIAAIVTSALLYAFALPHMPARQASFVGAAAPALLASLPLSAVAWVCGTALNAAGALRTALVIEALAILTAFGVALAARHGPVLLSFGFFGRELVIAALNVIGVSYTYKRDATRNC